MISYLDTETKELVYTLENGESVEVKENSNEIIKGLHEKGEHREQLTDEEYGEAKNIFKALTLYHILVPFRMQYEKLSMVSQFINLHEDVLESKDKYWQIPMLINDTNPNLFRVKDPFIFKESVKRINELVIDAINNPHDELPEKDGGEIYLMFEQDFSDFLQIVVANDYIDKLMSIQPQGDSTNLSDLGFNDVENLITSLNRIETYVPHSKILFKKEKEALKNDDFDFLNVLSEKMLDLQKNAELFSEKEEKSIRFILDDLNKLIRETKSKITEYSDDMMFQRLHDVYNYLLFEDSLDKRSKTYEILQDTKRDMLEFEMNMHDFHKVVSEKIFPIECRRDGMALKAIPITKKSMKLEDFFDSQRLLNKLGKKK